MQWVTFFCLSWRVHLVGPRRVWHPHHYFNVSGYRAGQLLARPSAQISSLSRALGLLESLFSRGARIWGFGINSFFAQPEWGITWPEWMPGQLTNSVFQRSKRDYFIHQAVLYDSKRRLKRFKRRSFSRGYFLNSDSEIESSYRLFSFRRNALCGGFSTFNFLHFQKVAFLLLSNIKGLRQPISNLVKPILDDHRRPGRLSLKRQMLKVNLVQNIFKKLQRRKFKLAVSGSMSLLKRPSKLKRLRLINRQKVLVQNRYRSLQSLRPFRKAQSYQSMPFQFPSVIVAVGLGSNRSLLSEANTLGIPVIYFQNSGISPNLSPFSIIWGTEYFRSRGIYYLIEQSYYRVWTDLFLNTVWSRLA